MILVSSMDTEPNATYGTVEGSGGGGGGNELTISTMLTFYLSCHERGIVISHIKRKLIVADDTCDIS